MELVAIHHHAPGSGLKCLVVPITGVMILSGSSMYYFYAIIGHDPTPSFDTARPTWVQTPMEFLIIVTLFGYEGIRPFLNKYLEGHTQSHTEEKSATSAVEPSTCYS